MPIVTIHTAKTTLSQLIARAEAGEEIVLARGALPGQRRDPFDRMLIAQAMLEDMILVSNEPPFDAFGVRRLW